MSSPFMKPLTNSSTTESRYECTLCNCNVINFQQHEKTQKHSANLVKYNEEKKVKKDDINVFIAEIAMLKKHLNERNEEIARINNTAVKHQEAVKQEETIKKNEETIDKQYELIQKHHDTIQKQDEIIEKQDKTIAKHQETIEKNQETIEEQHNEIIALKEKIADIIKNVKSYKEEINKIEQTAAEKKRELYNKLLYSM